MKKILLNIRYRTKMIFVALTILLIVSLIIINIINENRKTIFHQYITDLSSSIGLMLTNQIKHNMRHHSTDHFQLLLEELNFAKEVTGVNVYDNSYKIVFSTKPEKLGMIDSLSINHEKLEKTGQYYTNSTEDGNMSSINLIYGIYNQPECYRCHDEDVQDIGFLRLDIDNTREVEMISLFRIYDMIVFSSLLLLFFVIMVTAHYHFFQIPFNKIQEGVKLIRAGKLETRLNVNTKGELSQMAKTINEMTENLERSRNKIDELHSKQIDRAGQLATIGEMAASVAHEIKNPISGIRTALQVFTTRCKDLITEEISLEMFSQMDRITKTIDDLLSFSRPPKLKFTELDINEVLQNAISLYRKQFVTKNIHFIEEYDDNCPFIRGDPDLLKQVFVNLLINAFQAVSYKKNGQIIIKTKYDKISRDLLVSFEDNGLGIDTEVMDKIFKPFYTTKHKGSGLGLSLSQSIIKKHHGIIIVKSERGQGSVFTVKFPENSLNKGIHNEI